MEQFDILNAASYPSPWKVEWLESIDSTNSELLRRLPSLDNMSVLAAISQTSGRGQRGNKWKSTVGKNLTFSYLLRPSEGIVPPLAARDQFRLSEVAALSVASTLNHFGLSPRIKWPNDIYLGDRKVCGMLIENSLADGKVGTSVVGIGLNVNQRTFPADLVNPCSMSLLSGREFPLEEVLGILLQKTAELLPLISAPSILKDLFEQRLYRKGEEADYTDCQSEEKIRGTILGITPGGLLRVDVRGLGERHYAFKEISYII